jgi:RNA polymerase sigma factor (TIGR02999 family)
MSDVTHILTAIESGDPHAAQQLLPLVYNELRWLAAARLAQERPGQTLQPTALVHEAYLRLVQGPGGQEWSNRRHFFAAAAEAMRRILVESARRRQSAKRGGQGEQIPFGEQMFPVDPSSDEVLEVDEALQRLAELHPERAELVRLRYFAGLTSEEAAQALGMTKSQAERSWTYARAWLLREISRNRTPAGE